MLPDLGAAGWLAVADAAVLCAAGAGYVAIRLLPAVAAPDLPAAFAVLERSIGRYASGIPGGYTWGEAFDWLKEKGVSADWGKMEKALGEYESYRYGGAPAPHGGERDVVGLAQELRRGRVGK